MIKTGLASVTFRKLTAKDVILLAASAKIDGIEWGGDLHVPPDNCKNAREVCQMTQENGLQVAAYGSYYRVGVSENEQTAFSAILETAAALNAPVIRVWAGNRASADASAAEWDKIVGDSLRIAEAAAKQAIDIAFEYHQNTLTDTISSAAKLMQAINHRHAYSYWQPLDPMSDTQKAESLKSILPWLKNVHLQYIRLGKLESYAEGKEIINQYLGILHAAKKDCFAIIEFVKNNSERQFLEDAAVLTTLLCSRQKDIIKSPNILTDESETLS